MAIVVLEKAGREMSRDDRGSSDLDIAVIGMSGRFPGAPDLRQYWANIRDGVESITTLSDATLAGQGVDPAMLRDPHYVKVASMLDGVEMFDAGFFGYSPKEAELMDPQGRLFLECAWEALESAGYPPTSYPGAIGVYATESLNTYLLHHLRGGLDFQSFVLAGGNLSTIVANNADFLTTRVSYKLNLRGPSINVQSACSSSLVAIHLARQSLLNGECEIALAGGVSVYLPQQVGYLYQEGSILSPDGRCRPFDAAANGTVFGRGVGVVVLKPLTEAIGDGDCIRAVIKGSAINNDGAFKVGYTAPGVQGQAEVIADAIANAGIHPETIGYIEAHGTGTRQGDPIEIAALTEAFRARTDRRGFCALGSVKGNFGHLDVAAGIAGFIKVVLMLEHRLIPPTLHFTAPNPQIDFAGSPFFVNTVLAEWQRGGGPRRAGVSSFGMGGTNAHLVVEEAPAPATDGMVGMERAHVLTVTAKSEQALRGLAGRWASHLATCPEAALADLCFTANQGRTRFAHRVAWVVASTSEARGKLAEYATGGSPVGTLEGRAAAPTIAFVFPGQGAQYPSMGAQLYESERVFRAALEECEAALPDPPTPAVRAILRGQGTSLEGTADAQVALFAVEYAVAATWREWGIKPAYVLGHSVGEYAAACIAGALELPEAIRLVVARGRLMQALAPGGVMAVVFAPEARVAASLVGHATSASIAAVNGPEHVVIAGTAGAVASVLDELRAEGIQGRPLSSSHAFHSPLIEPALEGLQRVAEDVPSRPPRVGWISTLTGEPVLGPVSPAYWRRQAREAVRFQAAVATAVARGCDTFVEVGPGVTLTAVGARSWATESQWVASLRHQRDERRHMLAAAAALYTRGATIDWARAAGDQRGRRMLLPTYPFERKRYWTTPPVSVQAPGRPSTPPVAARDVHPLLGHRLHSAAFTGVVFESELGLADVTVPR